MYTKLSTLFFIALLFCSCQNDKVKINDKTNSSDTSIEEINIRLAKDPPLISPFFRSSSEGREVYQNIFLTLADFHPDNLQLYPILLTEMPKEKIETIDGTECVSYTMELKPEAKWSDGTAITNLDIDFTLKMVNHPLCDAIAWKPYFSELKSIKLDPTNNKKLTVSFAKDYMLSLEAATTIHIMPAHLFDPSSLLAKYKIAELIQSTETNFDTIETKLLEKINSSFKDKKGVIQSGPYRLSSFETNQYIQLEKIPDYWGQAYPENVFLQANTKKITFKIVADELTAITMAKEGTLDLMMMKQSSAFLGLKEDETFNDKWSFHVPQLNRYYYLALNNKSPILSDRNVRNALAHLTDVDDYIESIDGGLGVRTNGPFHPAKFYYNTDLAPIPYDIAKAKKILAEAGWSDIAGDGILEKIIDGKPTKLELDVLMTGSELAKSIALLFQESAIKAGVKINVVSTTGSLLGKEHIYPFKYEIAMLATTLDANVNDPYRKWHSDNKDNGRHNVASYSNPKVDKLITDLRSTKDEGLWKKYFFEIQEEMHKDQPCIFLYCPLNKIIISKKYQATSSTKRPGYMANTFTKAGG